MQGYRSRKIQMEVIGNEFSWPHDQKKKKGIENVRHALSTHSRSTHTITNKQQQQYNKNDDQRLPDPTPS